MGFEVRQLGINAPHAALVLIILHKFSDLTESSFIKRVSNSACPMQILCGLNGTMTLKAFSMILFI